MRVSAYLTDERFSVDYRAMVKLARTVLAAEKGDDWFVNIVYCKDKETIELNRRFKNKKKTTDVLAFDLTDRSDGDCLGEVYVNLQQAKRQAKENEVPYDEEVKRLTVHGLLHLLGYRDDTLASAEKMWKHQEGYIHHGKKR